MYCFKNLLNVYKIKKFLTTVQSKIFICLCLKLRIPNLKQQNEMFSKHNIIKDKEYIVNANNILYSQVDEATRNILHKVLSVLVHNAVCSLTSFSGMRLTARLRIYERTRYREKIKLMFCFITSHGNVILEIGD